MFKKLEQFLAEPLAVQIMPDEKGYFDRNCPDQNCKFSFKVFEEDWINIFRNDAVYCPKCRHKSISDNFFPDDSLDEFDEVISQYIDYVINQDVDNYIESMGFTKVGGSNNKKPSLSKQLIINAKDVFENEIQCEICNARYAVIGSAFFCPCCGNNSIEKTFLNYLNRIEQSLTIIPVMKNELLKTDKDIVENVSQALLEKSFTDCIGAFQSFCENKYFENDKAEKKIKLNAFQNIDIGMKLWQSLLNKTYKDWLNVKEFSRLVILFQRRHLLEHSSGIVDQKYIDRSKDTTYKIGQRIVIVEKDIFELAGYIKIITNSIQKIMYG